MGTGGQRHAPAALPPGKRHDTHGVEGLLGLGVGLEGGQSETISLFIRKPYNYQRPSLFLNFKFFGPCIVIHLLKKDQQDALFFLNFFQ